MDKKITVSSNALCFADPGCFAITSVQETEPEKKAKLNMKVYSGSVIKGHWYWGDLAIDLSGIDVQGEKFPILEDHDIYRRIGFSGKPVIQNDGVYIDPETTVLVDTPTANEFVALSKQGFPFQSSISIIPLSVERLDEDVETTVNGYSFKGPGTIFRKSLYREASVCVFGWDSNTSSAVAGMSKSNGELELNFKETVVGKEVEKPMDITELKEKYPDLIQKIQEEVKAELSKTTLKNQETETLIAELSQKLQASEAKVLELEKKDAIRAEREIALRAENIWTVKLSESSLNESLYPKVRKHVSHADFVKDGKFDEEGFSKAIDTEIEDWEKLIPTSTPVIGTGFSHDATKVTVEKTISDLAALAGIK
jgi:hypothetical protein